MDLAQIFTRSINLQQIVLMEMDTRQREHKVIL